MKDEFKNVVYKWFFNSPKVGKYVETIAMDEKMYGKKHIMI